MTTTALPSLCCDSHLKMDARFPWRQF